jgi:hypothetical protein
MGINYVDFCFAAKCFKIFRFRPLKSKSGEEIGIIVLRHVGASWSAPGRGPEKAGQDTGLVGLQTLSPEAE